MLKVPNIVDLVVFKNDMNHVLSITDEGGTYFPSDVFEDDLSFWDALEIGNGILNDLGLGDKHIELFVVKSERVISPLLGSYKRYLLTGYTDEDINSKIGDWVVEFLKISEFPLQNQSPDCVSSILESAELLKHLRSCGYGKQ